ncbi:TlpA family protein disulfide reductase [bacterium]|nr:TlpA family protein disulfide reductase [candidate division CSSED10-310 bacterium]
MGRIFFTALIAIFLVVSSAAAGPAPAFELKDLDGNLVKLEDQKGRVVLVSFWTTYCQPCRKELPKLNEIYGELKDKGLVFFSISSDKAADSAQVSKFVKQFRYTFPVLLDVDSAVVEKYHPERTPPFTALIDHEGNLRHTHRGYKPGDEVRVREELLALLEELPENQAAGVGEGCSK